MDILATPAFWVSLTALTFLEIVLGIDNLLFVSIAIGKLKGKQQDQARRVGVWGAMVLRIIMLSGVFWIIQLDEHPLFALPEGWAALILLANVMAAAEINALVGPATPDKASGGKKLLATLKGTFWAGFVLTLILYVGLDWLM